MSKRRKLTAREKEQAIEAKRRSEQAAHPDAQIRVTADDETDDDGNPVVHVVRSTHGFVPQGKP
jgi:hypothetical protein